LTAGAFFVKTEPSSEGDIDRRYAMKPSIIRTVTDLAVATWAKKVMGAESDEDVSFYATWIDGGARWSRIPRPLLAAAAMVAVPVAQAVILVVVDYGLQRHSKDIVGMVYGKPSDVVGPEKGARA